MPFGICDQKIIASTDILPQTDSCPVVVVIIKTQYPRLFALLMMRDIGLHQLAPKTNYSKGVMWTHLSVEDIFLKVPMFTRKTK